MRVFIAQLMTYLPCWPHIICPVGRNETLDNVRLSVGPICLLIWTIDYYFIAVTRHIIVAC